MSEPQKHFLGMLAAIPLAVVGIMLIGLMFETLGEYKEEKERCYKQASTHYDYHKCD